MITTTLKLNYNVSEVDIQTSNGRNGLDTFVGGHTCTTTDDGAVDGAEEPQITGTKNTTFAAMVNNNTWLYSANPTELDLLKTIVWRGLERNQGLVGTKTTSTRRLTSRPSGVALLAKGAKYPIPSQLIWVWEIWGN